MPAPQAKSVFRLLLGLAPWEKIVVHTVFLAPRCHPRLWRLRDFGHTTPPDDTLLHYFQPPTDFLELLSNALHHLSDLLDRIVHRNHCLTVCILVSLLRCCGGLPECFA